MPVYRHQGRREVYYELYGREGDPVVTICNGLAMKTSHWAPYFEQLPRLGIRVLSYDMLGQGASAKPVLGVGFDDHAYQLHDLHEHLGIERPYVLGISFGGVVVLKYACLFPERIGGLLPISTFSELDPQLRGHARNLYIGMARVGFDYFLDLLMPLNFSNAWLERNAHMLELTKRLGVVGNELYAIQNLMESMRDFQSMTHELVAIRCPTLVLNGEYDTLTPRHHHDILRRAIPNSRLMIVPRMCHAFTLEAPALVARIIADFVQAVEQGSWRGDQSVWIAAEDPAAKDIATPYPEPFDPLRNLPLDREGKLVTGVTEAKSSGEKPRRTQARKRTGAKKSDKT